MLRRLRTILLIASAILCIAAMGLWVLGRQRTDRFVHVSPAGTYVECASEPDMLSLIVIRDGPGGQSGHYTGHTPFWFYPSTGLHSKWDILGIEFTHGAFSIPTYGSGSLFIEETDKIGETPDRFNGGPVNWPMGHGFAIQIPALLMAALFFLPLLASWVAAAGKRLRTMRRLRDRRCSQCGYDLRATPQRCPECGTAVKGAA